MRLHEISEPVRIYYHGSENALTPGTILRPGVGGFLKSTKNIRATERILAAYRPSGAIPRTKSVFMTDDPDMDLIVKAGGFGDYIYRVEAMDAVERNDAGWWTKIARDIGRHLKHGGVLRDIDASLFEREAKAYWAGEKCPDEGYPWEYRTLRARVLDFVDSSFR